MKALNVLAHPEPGSYNHALADVARNVLSSGHDEVRLADLYAQGFQPDEHPRHFPLRADPQRFNAQSEQRFSADRKILPIDVARAVDDNLWSDLVLLQSKSAIQSRANS